MIIRWLGIWLICVSVFTMIPIQLRAQEEAIKKKVEEAAKEAAEPEIKPEEEKVEAKRLVTVVTLGILLVVSILLGSSCAPRGSLGISVTELDNGVMIENVGEVDCLFFVSSPEGQQQFELAVGQNTTVTGLSQPIEVSAVSQWPGKLGG